jgi:hypothetical protein
MPPLIGQGCRLTKPTMPREIPLTKGAVAIVDDADYERMTTHRWCLTSSGYARRSINPARGKPYQHEFMHRVIAGAPKGTVVDHINGNKLDNRRENLRICSAAENRWNRPKPQCASRSQYKGVHFIPTSDRWRAAIYVKHKKHNLGTFATELDAAQAYDRAAKELHGQFAVLNFPDC